MHYSELNKPYDVISLYVKKHSCPVCGNKLKIIKVTKFVHRNSEEAKNWSFSLPGSKFLGDALFYVREFFCLECGYQIRDNDLGWLENKMIQKGSDKIYWEINKKTANEKDVYQPKMAVKYLQNADPKYIYETTENRKRLCHDCKTVMVSTYDYKIIDSNSPEAKGYDFTIGGKQIEGRVEFRDGYFWCPNKKCDTKISFADMKKLETGTY